MSSNRTVLVADDDATTRVLVGAALKQDGWIVEEAADGASTCEAVERTLPDIVLLDVHMPKLDGFEVCARLRSQPRARHISIMMMTGIDDQESIDRAFEVGATDFLSKPFNFMVLRQRLQYMYRAQQDARELRNERDFVAAVVDHSAALVVILDPAGRIVRFNESCEHASGLSLSEVKGKQVWDVLSSPEERDRERAAFERMISGRGTSHYEGSWATRDGNRHEIAWSSSVLLDGDGRVEHVVCTGLDITDRNQAQERLRFLASYDPLTGLPNRRLFTERLEQAIAAADREPLAVLVLNLDHFSEVNATWGHSTGDQLLTEVADRLAKSLRLSDVLARHQSGTRTELGRLGDDEFIALVTSVPDATEVAGIAQRLQRALGRPFRLQNEEFRITASIGATLYPADGSDGKTLLRNAESAMQAVREGTRGTCRFYSAAIRTSVSERLSLENELRQAIDVGELVLYYQPKVFTHSGHIAGAEALVRWQHPSRGLVAAEKFIQVAEKAGLLVPIGQWSLRTACGQVMSWLEAGLRAVPMAVNVSSAQFQAVDLLDWIVSILNETALDPHYLAIEITEGTMMRHMGEVHEIVCRLRELGVQVAIDDFGTGYSSFGTIRELPFSQLKIDKSFVRNLAGSAKDRAITGAIIAMAHGLGLTVVAEGVESEEQLEVLREEGCDEVQGFLIGEPLSSDQFAALLGEPPGHRVEVAAAVSAC